jgi:CDGSH-type Zn-finger protein
MKRGDFMPTGRAFRRQRYSGRDRRMEEPMAKITPYRNGPYLIRGPFLLVDQEGNEIEVKRRVVALCRCGRSRSRPFCDGTHKTAGFRADSAAASVLEPGLAPESASAPEPGSAPEAA